VRASRKGGTPATTWACNPACLAEGVGKDGYLGGEVETGDHTLGKGAYRDFPRLEGAHGIHPGPAVQDGLTEG
jgi:hypothetical protein